MNIQLIKKRHGRRRFLKTGLLVSTSEWISVVSALKGEIVAESQFQQVGHKIYFEVHGEEFRPMLEVVGVPRNLEQKTMFLADQEAGEVLVYEFKDGDLFSLELDLVQSVAQKIMETLSVGDNKLFSTYHIVLEEEKIALHFFRQKDYSQKLL